jgi:PAS domain-containing protein
MTLSWNHPITGSVETVGHEKLYTRSGLGYQDRLCSYAAGRLTAGSHTFIGIRTIPCSGNDQTSPRHELMVGLTISSCVNLHSQTTHGFWFFNGRPFSSSDNGRSMHAFTRFEGSGVLKIVGDSLAMAETLQYKSVLSRTPEGVITIWNKSAEQMFGFPAEEVVGRHISIIIPDDRFDEVKDIIVGQA